VLQRQVDALQAQQSILSAGDSLSSADHVVVLELRVVNARAQFQAAIKAQPDFEPAVLALSKLK
jgi:hypothetical protein